MGPYRPYFPKMSWLVIGGEDLQKIVGNRRKASARVRESSARQEEKKEGGMGGGRQERKREGWVREGQKKRGGWGR